MRLGPRATALFILVVLIPLVFAEMSSTNYKITSYAVDSGGSNVTSSSYKTDFTLGSIAKAIVGTLYKLFLGFFYTVLDSVSPTVTVIAPVNNSNFNVSSVGFNASLNDIGSGCMLSISGGANVSMSANSSYEGFNFTNSSMSEGYHTFNVYCNDTSNNFGFSGTYSLLVDTVYPSLSYVEPSPRDNGGVNSTLVTLNVSVLDVTSSTTYSFFDDGLVGWWRMDDVNGSGDPFDISGQGNDGDAQGNAVQTGAGRFGEGFSFDGDGDQIDFGASNFNFSTQNFTIVGWTKPVGDISDIRSIFKKGSPRNNDEKGYELHWDGNRMRFSINNGTGGKEQIYTATKSLGVWYQVAVVVVYNGINWTDSKIYIDGAEDTTGTITKTGSIENTAVPSIGVAHNGTIDEVLIFNRSLSSDEIAALYNSTKNQTLRALTLPEGVNSYTAHAVDEGGNRNSSPIKFSVDLTNPTINFSNPTLANASIVADNYIFVNVSSDDTNNISTFIDFDDSLVSWWRFDDLNETGGVVDYMGRNDGTVNGDAKQVTAGYFGKGFEFDGDGDYVETPDFDFGGITDFTVSMWAKVLDESVDNGLLDKKNLVFQFVIREPLGEFDVWMTTDNEGWHRAVIGQYNGYDSKWHNYVMVYNGTEVRVYRDGVDDTQTQYTTTGAITSSNDNFRIGRAGSIDFNGTIDDVMIFNRSLSANEIRGLYANQTSRYLDVNFTSLSHGLHNFKAYSQDIGGNVNSTELRTIDLDITPPRINFTAPTPENGTNQSETYVEINVSVVDDNLGDVKYDWNGTNFTYYNGSLVLMMNFDNLSALGETTVGLNNQTTDVSRYGNNGTFMGDATINKTNYKYGGGAAQFDGDGDYVEVGEVGIGANGTATISMWVYRDRTGVHEGAWSNAYMHSSNNYIYWRGTNSYFNYAFSTINKWYHIVVTYSGNVSTSNLYVDGGSAISCTEQAGAKDIDALSNLDIGNTYDNSYWNGTIDEVMIWNRSLSAAEVYQLYVSNLYKFNSSQWYLYVNQSLNATDRLGDGNYTYSAHASDSLGNWNETEERSLVIDSTAPVWQNNQSNLTGDDKINQDRWFYVNWSDYTGLNSYIFSWNGTGSWVNDSGVTMVGTVNASNVTKTIIRTQGNTIGWRFYANDSLGNINATDIWTFTVNNTAPTKVNLSYPVNNSVITNTTPRFNWTNSTDADNDTIYYDLIIRCLGGCSVDNRELNNLTDANYTPSPPLKYYQDDGYSYKWWVIPLDNTTYGANSSIFNFTIASSVAISLPTANVSFGELSINKQNDTTDDNPSPIVIQNDGNSYINVNITVDSYLWGSVQSESTYFQYKIDNVTGEEGAFNWTASANSWTNFTLDNATGIYRFNYSDDRDSAEVDINITVPPNEEPGKKESNILFTGYYVVVT